MVELGLIGYPLGHSFSAGYFAKKFAEEGISGRYDLYPIASASEIGTWIERHLNLRGFNVTIPYKQAIMPYLGSMSDDATAIGAVNTVKIYHTQDGGSCLKGFNTDWRGFRDSLVPLLRPDVTHALVLGTGGASKAVGYALANLGITPLYVSRTPAETFFGHAIGYDSITAETMRTHLLIVNTTPLGMSPKTDASPPIPYDLIGPSHICYDLVYNPLETKFMQLASRRGARVKNGLEMLHLQADYAWQIWEEE